MNNKNLISVVVPVYNVENYLRKCVDSILNQTYKNLQIILVDDGSTDSSGNICDEYANRDNRIEVIHKKNGGLVSARKAGLKLATGEYISNVDSDDWIEPNMYEEMLENLIQTDADFVNAGYIQEREEMTKNYCTFDTHIINSPKNNPEIWEGFVDFTYKTRFNFYIWSKLFKRDLFIPCYENVPNDKSLGEDRIVITECLLRCKKVSVLSKTYYHYIIKKKDSYTSIRGFKKFFASW